jgi:hypothetical protein
MVYFHIREPNGANAKILKAIDFGLSQVLDRTHETENRANSWQYVIEPIGTPQYNSPELKYINDTPVKVLYPRAHFGVINFATHNIIILQI